MAADRQATPAYEFGRFRLEAAERLLLRDGEPVPLAPKVFDTLLALIERGGHLVTKDEMMSKLWPDSFVEEATLARNISDLRRALGEVHYIETVPRHGYRFAAPVRRSTEEPATLIVEKHTHARTIIEEAKETDGQTDEKAVFPRFSLKSLSLLRLEQPGRAVALATILTIIALPAIALIVYRYTAHSSRSQSLTISSLAVLPLKNLSDDPAQEYFSDGITESLISALSQIEQLKVISRGSVFRYKGKEVDPREVGRQLGVAAVLEGSVRKGVDSVRVAVRLVSVEDGRVLWARDTQDRALGDIFALQDEVARSIAEGLRVELGGAAERQLARRHTADLEAYQLYLKGRYLWNKRTREELRKGIEYFEQAIARDPNYALAYAGLADCYALLSPYNVAAPKEAYPKAKAAARKALALDGQLAEAHTALANVIYLYDWDWAGAEREFRRAIELNPNYPTAHQWYAVYLSSMGRHAEAQARAKQAQQLDPLSIAVTMDLARTFYHARQYDEAIAAWLKILELEPNYYRPSSWLEKSYEQAGRYDEAVAAHLKAIARFGPERVAELKEAYETSGWRGYWQKRRDVTLALTRQLYISPYYVAGLHARLGKMDQALEWLERASAEHSDHLVLLKVDPVFDDLRTDPRFAGLVRRVGLAP